MQALSDIHDGAIVDLGVPPPQMQAGSGLEFILSEAEGLQLRTRKSLACGVSAAIRHALVHALLTIQSVNFRRGGLTSFDRTTNRSNEDTLML